MNKVHSNISTKQTAVKNGRRDRIEMLYHRVDLLSGKDKILMTMYLRNGNSFGQIARLIGVDQATVGRRINKVMKRLVDGEYIACLRNRDKLSIAELEIARKYFLCGMSIRVIAEKQRLSYYRVRLIVKRIESIIA